MTNERLKGAENPARSDFRRFTFVNYEIKPSGSFSFETVSGITFDISVRRPPDILSQGDISPEVLQTIMRSFKENSRWSFCPRQQSYEHLSTAGFLCANWKSILSLLKLDYFGEIFCFPEVMITDPMNTFRNIPVDLLGYDGNGVIHAGEISSLNRKGKIKQLGRNIGILKALYPDINFAGFLAFYKGVAKNKIEIALNFPPFDLWTREDSNL